MLWEKIIAAYSEDDKKSVITPYGQNWEFLNFKAGGTYSYHLPLPV
jgi:hypothetical protein